MLGKRLTREETLKRKHSEPIKTGPYSPITKRLKRFDVGSEEGKFAYSLRWPQKMGLLETDPAALAKYHAYCRKMAPKFEDFPYLDELRPFDKKDFSKYGFENTAEDSASSEAQFNQSLNAFFQKDIKVTRGQIRPKEVHADLGDKLALFKKATDKIIADESDDKKKASIEKKRNEFLKDYLYKAYQDPLQYFLKFNYHSYSEAKKNFIGSMNDEEEGFQLGPIDSEATLTNPQLLAKAVELSKEEDPMQCFKLPGRDYTITRVEGGHKFTRHVQIGDVLPGGVIGNNVEEKRAQMAKDIVEFWFSEATKVLLEKNPNRIPTLEDYQKMKYKCSANNHSLARKMYIEARMHGIPHDMITMTGNPDNGGKEYNFDTLNKLMVETNKPENPGLIDDFKAGLFKRAEEYHVKKDMKEEYQENMSKSSKEFGKDQVELPAPEISISTP